MTILGQTLIDSEESPIVIPLPPGLFRFHIFATGGGWSGRTLLLRAGLSSASMLDVTDGSFTVDGQLFIYGGCLVTVYESSAQDYSDLTALISRADSGIW